MKTRIEKLLHEVGMSPSLFADAIGVQRATISHILSGRNNPSLDFVQKILSRFPEINPDWILSGKGEMWRATAANELREDNTSSAKTKNQHLQTKLFDQGSRQEFAKTGHASNKNLAKNQALISEQKDAQVQAPEVQKKTHLSALKTGDKAIMKVIVLYNDHTFESFTEI